ncbi:EDS1 protein [Spatholobus suberectus]|nr:EDS1 protein [Spatholobus suberectus]
MAGGSLGDKIGLKEELIKKACGLAFKAHKPPEKIYRYEKFQISQETYHVFSFSGSWDAAEWFVNKPFGETKIDLALFPSLRSIGNDEAALVNEGFAKRFDNIWKTTSIKSEVNKAMVDGRQVVFTGHSSGAAMAILATFWALENYLNQIKNQSHKPPFCVTFGSPLIGNHIFSHASRRENWSRYFIHFVLRYDIVPRILLAPFSSIEQTFGSILQFLNPKSKTSTQDSTRASVISDFYSTVMRNAASVTSHAACILMGSTNLLLETVANFVDLSPYRPFGTYVFCNGKGQLIVVKNSDAVLQLLFHTAQLSNLAELPQVADDSISQHLVYETELGVSLIKQNVEDLEQLEELPLSADGSNSDVATRISAALDGLGLSTRARLCLRAAGELEKRKRRNEEKIINEIKKKGEASMGDLETYKTTCEVHKGKGYYDAFKVQKEANDFQANVKRLELAGVWDEVIEMLKRYELPDEFEGDPKWIQLGTSFRRLVEPLDIANYYRHLKNEDTGPYMARARPKRYRYTQRWLEQAKREPKSDVTESTFWAEVEELFGWINSKKPFEDVRERVLQLEQDLIKWTDRGELTKDTFLKDPNFIKWWEILPQEHKATSHIATIVKG